MASLRKGTRRGFLLLTLLNNPGDPKPPMAPSCDIGVFFGTFDVFHKGHWAMAQAALDEAGLKHLVVIPAFSPPNKSGADGLVPAHAYFHRLAMARLACAADARIAVSDLEACLPTPSYTIATLRALFPGFDDFDPHRIAFLAGLDTYRSLGQWKEAAVLIRQLHFLVVPRHQADVPRQLEVPGYNKPLPTSVQVIESFRDDAVSASHLKSVWAQQQSASELTEWVPEAVAQYMQTYLLPRQDMAAAGVADEEEACQGQLSLPR